MRKKKKYEKPKMRAVELELDSLLASSGNTEQYTYGRYYDPNAWE